MKMFLLGMLTMYLGTCIVALIVDITTDAFTADFLEAMFYFPLFVISVIIKYGRTFFQRNCWYLVFHGVNPWFMTFGKVCNKLNDEQIRKFIELSPKKDQKNFIKVFTDFRGYDIMDISKER